MPVQLCTFSAGLARSWIEKSSRAAGRWYPAGSVVPSAAASPPAFARGLTSPLA